MSEAQRDLLGGELQREAVHGILLAVPGETADQHPDDSVLRAEPEVLWGRGRAR